MDFNLARASAPLTRFAAVSAFAVMMGAPAQAADDGGSGPIMSCPSGQVRDASGKCIKQSNNAIDHEARVAYGLMLARSERFDEAIAVLKHASEPNDPRVLNYIGYSLRKSGRMEDGIGYYMRALSIDPNYVQAREYLGEAYLTMGRVDLAEGQLKEIETRCGSGCDTYLELADQIEDFRERATRS